MSTAAGQADEMTSGESVSARSFDTCELTDSAPCAVSLTPSKPAALSAAATWPIVTPLK